MPIRFRSFRNSDPPHFVDIWRSQPPERALAQPMSIVAFDQLIAAKQYFDPAGLIFAWDGDVPVGFAHAAFGPTDDGRGVARQMGVTHLVMVRPQYQRQGIGRELLVQAEEYLRTRGAGVLYAGGTGHLNGFYVGLYGGSELPGTLDSSPAAQRLFQAGGYREIDRVEVLQRDVFTFRPPIDRRLIQWRRAAQVRVIHDPDAADWWRASVYGNFPLIRFDVDLKSPGVKGAATAMFWLMETFSRSWGVQAAGLIDFEVKPELRRQGLAMFLLGEAFHQLRLQGISLVEAQTMVHNTAARELYKKLGFIQVDQGAVYRKA